LVSSAIRVLSVGTTTSYIKARRGADSTMLSSDSGGQPKGAGRAVQAGCGLESGTSGLRYRQFASLCVLALAGCSSFPSSINPVSWWHGLEGGKIAEERPPPPGADQPYPNLATVPPKPAQPDRAALDNIASALIADRSNAQHVAAEAPIADPSVPSASPALFGRGTVPPPPPPSPSGTAKASATMAAAEAPPAPPTPSQPATGGQTAAAPAKAPVGAVQSTPLAPPGAAAQPSPVQAAAPPPLPAAPPAPPNLPGVPQATASSAPAGGAPGPGWKAEPPPPPAATKVATATPTSPPPAKPTGSANSVSVTFVTGSAELQTFAADNLRQLAARRGNGIIGVTGYGDATSDDPTTQSAALTLGLSRAKAMAAALTAAGVPASAVQVDAAAIGRGGAARLIQ
jgi:outer membrane protein OmpA-like peptidoglycan-associated protein